MQQRQRVPRRIVGGAFVLFLTASLGLSILLQRGLSPIGDAAVAAVQERESRLTGLLLADSGTHFRLYDGTSYYPVRENGRALRQFTGHKVTLRGVVDPKTGVLAVSQVIPTGQ